MKKTREWLFVAFLVALAAAGGWLKETKAANLAEANVGLGKG